jgi:hypothetical protein
MHRHGNKLSVFKFTRSLHGCREQASVPPGWVAGPPATALDAAAGDWLMNLSGLTAPAAADEDGSPALTGQAGRQGDQGR